jgi:phage gp29-like protein
MAPRSDLSELGTTGLRRSGGYINEEFLPNLRGTRAAMVYREMADNDAVIGSILFAMDKIVTRLEWHVEECGDSKSQIAAAEFVEECLNDMSDSWDATLSSILSMLVFGYSYHEIVYKKRGGYTDNPKTRSKYNDNRIGWRKFAIRAQETLNYWLIDEDGGIQGFVQMDPSGGGIRTIPIEKSLLFRTSAQKNNPEGRSLLRNAYRSWYFKKRIEEIEAIGIERDLAGLPVAYVPPEYLSSNATPDQSAVLNAVQSIVSNIKRNEQEGVVFPVVFDDSGNRMFELSLLSSGGSRQFDTDTVISRYDQRIAMTILSDFILLGHEKVGSFALGSSKVDLWTMAVDAVAKSIAEVINQHAIPRLMRLNGWKDEDSPKIVYGEVSHVDLRELAEYMSKLTAAGLLMPDDRLEEFLRDVAGLPAADDSSAAREARNPKDESRGPDGKFAPKPKKEEPTSEEPDAADIQTDAQDSAAAESTS